MSRRPWKSLARIAATVAACWSVAAQAQDAGSVTYFFSGDCSSCAIASGSASFPVMARLTLQDYVPGDSIDAHNVQSLWYTGSNLVDMFTLTGPTETLSAGRVFDATSITSAGGQLGPQASVPLAFNVEFANGLFFRTAADGSWSVCGPKGNGYSAGCFEGGADVGTGRWMITQVPEPSVALLLAGGLAALALLRRRMATAASYSLAPIARERSR